MNISKSVLKRVPILAVLIGLAVATSYLDELSGLSDKKFPLEFLLKTLLFVVLLLLVNDTLLVSRKLRKIIGTIIYLFIFCSLLGIGAYFLYTNFPHVDLKIEKEDAIREPKDTVEIPVKVREDKPKTADAADKVEHKKSSLAASKKNSAKEKTLIVDSDLIGGVLKYKFNKKAFSFDVDQNVSKISVPQNSRLIKLEVVKAKQKWRKNIDPNNPQKHISIGNQNLVL